MNWRHCWRRISGDREVNFVKSARYWAASASATAKHNITLHRYLLFANKTQPTIDIVRFCTTALCATATKCRKRKPPKLFIFCAIKKDRKNYECLVPYLVCRFSSTTNKQSRSIFNQFLCRVQKNFFNVRKNALHFIIFYICEQGIIYTVFYSCKFSFSFFLAFLFDFFDFFRTLPELPCSRSLRIVETVRCRQSIYSLLECFIESLSFLYQYFAPLNWQLNFLKRSCHRPSQLF